jgi:hypothetical protein
MKFRPLLVMMLALNAVFVSGGVGLLAGSFEMRRESAPSRLSVARAEAAAVVAVSGVAKGAVRLLVWSVKTGSIQ